MSDWRARDDFWWARIAAAIAAGVLVIGALSAGRKGLGPVLEVAAWSSVSVIALVVASVRRLPGPLLFAVVSAPAVVLIRDESGEGAMFLVVVAVSYSLLIEPDVRWRWAIAVAGVLVPPATLLIADDDWGWPFWMTGIAFGALSSVETRRFRSLVAELQATRERLAEQAVLAERRRVAGEVHDLVGHSLTVVLLHLAGVRRRLQHRPDDTDGFERALVDAETIARQSLAEVRASVVAMRAPSSSEARDGLGGATPEPPAPPAPRAADVAELVGAARAAGAEVTLHTSGELAGVEGVTGLAVYRVVQESLANAARHAPGAAVEVSIDASSPQAVVVDVADRGGHMTPASTLSSAGVGLVGMRERVELLGGSLEAGPWAGGWRVAVRLPRLPVSEPERERDRDRERGRREVGP